MCFTKQALTMMRKPVMLIIVSCTISSCATPNLSSDGQRQIDEGHAASGLASMREAMKREPRNLQYRLDYINRLAEESQKLIQRGEAQRDAGEFNAARASFAEALRLDATNDRARRGVTDSDRDIRHRDILTDAEAMVAAGKMDIARERTLLVLSENQNNPQGTALIHKIDAQIDAKRRAKEALTASQSVLKKPVSLQFRDANLRMVFEALSRTTGLNVIFDKDVRPDLKTTIFVRDGSVEDTVNLILLQNQLERKVLNVNTMFIYPATAAKKKEYQELKIRTFRISNGDAKYILTVLKSVLKIKEGLVDERTNTLVLRDTPEALEVAAKVIAAHDLVDAEIMLEVEVLEVSHDRLTDLGIKWPDSATISTPSGLSGGAFTLGDLKDLKRRQLLITPLSLGLNLKLQDIDANILASPRIRVRDREKAKILIGDKVPIITNTVTPVQTGSAVVTGSIQYIDVGIKLDAEPHVYPEGDIGIKLSLEVSNIVKEIAGPSGSLAYQIGTRSASTSLRLHDGESQILGGLISDSDRNAASKVPGIGQLPVLGRLFSNHNGDHSKNEIVLSITPRILRAQGIADESARDVWSGTETTILSNQLRLDAMSSVSGIQAGEPVAGNSGTRAVTVPIPEPIVSPPQVVSTVPVGADHPASQSDVRSTVVTPLQGVESANPTTMFPVTGGYPPTTAPSTPHPQSTVPIEPANAPLPKATTGGSIAPPDSSITLPQTSMQIEPINASIVKEKANSANTAVENTMAAQSAASESVASVSSETLQSTGRSLSGLVKKEFASDIKKTSKITWGKPDTIKVGGEFKIALNATGIDGARSLPLYIRYDPRVLSFIGAASGELSSRVGINTIEPVINDAAGRVNISMDAIEGKVFSGSGVLMNLTFFAKNSVKQTQLQMQVAQLSKRGAAGFETMGQQQVVSLRIEP